MLATAAAPYMTPTCSTAAHSPTECCCSFLCCFPHAAIPGLAGVVVIDVVEGTAIASLPYMSTVLQVRRGAGGWVVGAVVTGGGKMCCRCNFGG